MRVAIAAGEEVDLHEDVLEVWTGAHRPEIGKRRPGRIGQGPAWVDGGEASRLVAPLGLRLPDVEEAVAVPILDHGAEHDRAGAEAVEGALLSRVQGHGGLHRPGLEGKVFEGDRLEPS